MTPGSLMLGTAVVFVITAGILIGNFMSIFKGKRSIGGGMGAHLISGLIAGISGFGFVCGFIWFLVEKIAAK